MIYTNDGHVLTSILPLHRVTMLKHVSQTLKYLLFQKVGYIGAKTTNSILCLAK